MGKRPEFFIKEFFSTILPCSAYFAGNDFLMRTIARSLTLYAAKHPDKAEETIYMMLKELADLRQRTAALGRDAKTDALTGAGNRRDFEEHLDHILHSKRTPTGRHFVMLIDMDRFKDINDSHGHAAGDEALKHLVKTVKGVIRDTDAVCRIGGDEFAVILKDATSEGAANKFMQIRETFNKMAFDHDGKNIPVSATFADAELDADHEHSLLQIIQEVDEKLYAQKREKNITG